MVMCLMLVVLNGTRLLYTFHTFFFQFCYHFDLLGLNRIWYSAGCYLIIVCGFQVLN